MAEKHISQEFRLKNVARNYLIDEARKYLIEEINPKSTKPKKICTTLNYIEHFLI